MLPFRGSTQEKLAFEIFRFGYGKAVNDKKVPDPVGSEETTRAKSASKESELQAEGYEVMSAQYGLDTNESDVATVKRTLGAH